MYFEALVFQAIGQEFGSSPSVIFVEKGVVCVDFAEFAVFGDFGYCVYVVGVVVAYYDGVDFFFNNLKLEREESFFLEVG